MLVLSSPIHYTLELTPQCDNRCAGCGNVTRESTEGILSAGQWQGIFGQMAGQSAMLRLSGGEPTLHPEFGVIAENIDRLEIPFVIFTNALWKQPERLCHGLGGMKHFKGFLISLHGPTAGIHESFTGTTGSFAKTVDNIRFAIHCGLPVATSTVITNVNYGHIDGIIDLSEELGTDRAIFARYLPVRCNQITPNADQMHLAIDTVEARRKKGGKVQFSVCIPQCFSPSCSEGCHSGVMYCAIDPLGNMRPCTHSGLVCGNVLEAGIEEAWRGSAMDRWREKIPVPCQNCSAFGQCHGGCRAAAEIHDTDKDPLMGEPIQDSKAPEPLNLFEGAFVAGRFTVRQESFGYVLIRETSAIPVGFSAKPIIDALDGKMTLRQIRSDFGPEGLNFVGTLYRKGFVELKENRSDTSSFLF